MPVQSQRPLVNKLLACEPLSLNGSEYTTIDAALLATGDTLSVEELAKALNAADIPVSTDTLYRWRKAIRG